jgi:predicted CXXCH cytochrome family protein
VECVNCHAKADGKGGHVPVNAEGQFCAGCHSYTGVKIDCFDCHVTTPGPKKDAADATGAVAPEIAVNER